MCDLRYRKTSSYHIRKQKALCLSFAADNLLLSLLHRDEILYFYARLLIEQT